MELRRTCASCGFNPLLCGVDWTGEPCPGWARPNKITNVTDLRVGICQALGVEPGTPAEYLPALVFELRQDLHDAHEAMRLAAEEMTETITEARFGAREEGQ